MGFGQHHITQHKRFVPDGTHPNPSLSLRASFMLEPLDEIAANISLERRKIAMVIVKSGV